MGGYAALTRRLVALLAVAMSLWHMWIVAFGPPEVMFFRGGHLLFALTLLFLLFDRSGKAYVTGPGIFDLALVAASIAAIGYHFANHAQIIQRIPYIDDPTVTEMVLGTLCILLVLEGTRRVLGLALPLTALVFLGYALFVNRMDPLTLLDQLYLTTEGIFGSTLGVSAGYVIVFVLFGAFMERTGTGQLFMDFALALTGRQAGGPGKVSVISSSLFGTISGSAVANVMVDGPITIPLMKRTGFRPSFAAAVEAVASTGGQIMPPVMGAAAFVMAEFLAVSYFQVTLWAAIPSILYYVACFAAVHFEAKRRGLRGIPESEVPKLGRVMAERGHLFIPVFIVLIGMILGYSAPLAALAGTLACVPVALLRRSTREGITPRVIWDALEDGAKQALGVALACATAGIVIGVIALTGIGITFTALIVAVSQNSLILALVLTMAAGIVLGMGMPTTPAYIIMVSLLVPALIKLGVIQPAAHMFAFYFAILSAITPPVALAVFAAAGLAKADLWESGWAAMKVGAAGFIVPFMFVYEPALLLIGDPWVSARAFVTAFLGCICLAAGLHGYLLAPATLWQRGLLVLAALGLIDPTPITDLIGLVFLAIVVAVQWPHRAGAGSSTTAG